MCSQFISDISAVYFLVHELLLSIGLVDDQDHLLEKLKRVPHISWILEVKAEGYSQ